MDQEGQETGGDDGVTDPNVVAGPRTFEPVEVVEVHGSVERVLSLGRVHSLEMRSDSGEILVQQLHGCCGRHGGEGGLSGGGRFGGYEVCMKSGETSDPGWSVGTLSSDDEQSQEVYKRRRKE